MKTLLPHYERYTRIHTLTYTRTHLNWASFFQNYLLANEQKLNNNNNFTRNGLLCKCVRVCVCVRLDKELCMCTHTYVVICLYIHMRMNTHSCKAAT